MISIKKVSRYFYSNFFFKKNKLFPLYWLWRYLKSMLFSRTFPYFVLLLNKMHWTLSNVLNLTAMSIIFSKKAYYTLINYCIYAKEILTKTKKLQNKWKKIRYENTDLSGNGPIECGCKIYLKWSPSQDLLRSIWESRYLMLFLISYSVTWSTDFI